MASCLKRWALTLADCFRAIVVADPKNKGSRQLRQNVMLSLKAYGLNEGKLIIPDAIIYLKRFKRDVADKNLNWALEFWDNF